MSGVPALQSGGTEILGTHGSIYGPGGQSILEDSDGIMLIYRESFGSWIPLSFLFICPSFPLELAIGQLILFYYVDYYTPTTSKLGINRLDFSSGWPSVS